MKWRSAGWSFESGRYGGGGPGRVSCCTSDRSNGSCSPGSGPGCSECSLQQVGVGVRVRFRARVRVRVRVRDQFIVRVRAGAAVPRRCG